MLKTTKNTLAERGSWLKLNPLGIFFVLFEPQREDP
jgi:hypothetical protein